MSEHGRSMAIDRAIDYYVALNLCPTPDDVIETAEKFYTFIQEGEEDVKVTAGQGSKASAEMLSAMIGTFMAKGKPAEDA